ncbi:hypothetical protein TRFO_29815 [Tritrichomonas foetus]|uniref:RRM domain-containing protein n=1 Tax=Tritrichomonas foetus TaxID=1144522 RepID=A0A1J4JZI3_9EUKA|nr:hypothetical protein TRFO_29815 [Tritrichomonas foetus]|eukprot:OHT02940.1 hypothetical protein TRFO_29815 [Tritrichomonas foetus]
MIDLYLFCEQKVENSQKKTLLLKFIISIEKNNPDFQKNSEFMNSPSNQTPHEIHLTQQNVTTGRPQHPFTQTYEPRARASPNVDFRRRGKATSQKVPHHEYHNSYQPGQINQNGQFTGQNNSHHSFNNSQFHNNGQFNGQNIGFYNNTSFNHSFNNLAPRPRVTNTTPSTNVFINYIPAEFTEADLRILCSEYGEIMTSKIMINLETGQSKCFGFVRFRTLEQAQLAIQNLNGRQIGNKRLLAKYAESQEKKEKASMTVYIKRLPMTINSYQVTQLFSQFGEIIQIVPHVLDTIDPQFWRCFVRYTSFEAASAAIATMNNQIVAAGSRPIHVRYADESRLSGSLSYSEGLMQGSLLDNGNEMQLLPSFLLQ